MKNPYLYPYMEFQRFKHHPMIAELLNGGNVWHMGTGDQRRRVPIHPAIGVSGGALLGCSAGLVNVPRIKGNHNAMLSGKLAAEKAHSSYRCGPQCDTLSEYDTDLREGRLAAI